MTVPGRRSNARLNDAAPPSIALETLIPAPGAAHQPFRIPQE